MTTEQAHSHRLRSQKWRALNPEKHQAQQQVYRKRHPERIKAYHLMYRYKLTPAQFAGIFASQGEKCAICGGTEPKSKNGWHVDHCHTTEKIRGVLCKPCNTMLGNAADSTAVLRSAIKYLRGSK